MPNAQQAFPVKQITNYLKSKPLIIIATIFFLTVNTSYFWEGKVGFFALPAFLLLVIVYIELAIALIRQFYLAIKEGFNSKTRLFTIIFLIFVSILTYFKPLGLINFDRLEGYNILIAEREGVANCMTTLKLKDNYTFVEKEVCFGMTEIKGKYHIQNDTIYFDKVNIGRDGDEFYKFAVVKSLKSNKDDFSLIMYKNLTDTIGYELWITKNELYKLKDKKPSR